VNKKIAYTVVFLVVAVSLYIFSGMYAEKVSSEAIAEAEPAIKKAFRSIGGDFRLGKTVLSYDIAGASIRGNVDLENVILRNSPEQKSQEVSISISKMTVSKSSNFLTFSDGENFKAEFSSFEIMLDRFGVVDFPVAGVSQAKGIRETFEILSFSDLELRNLKIKEFEEAEVGFSLLSVGQLKEGRLTDLRLEGLSVHSDPAELFSLTVERISFDKLDGWMEVFLDGGGGNVASIKNGFSLGSGKLDNLQLKTGEMDDSLAIGSLSINLGRDEMLLNSLVFQIDDVGIATGSIPFVMPAGYLDEFNRDQFMIDAALDISADFPESSLSAEISLGIEELGELSAKLGFGGISRALFTSSVIPQVSTVMVSGASFRSADLTYGDDGLSEILFSVLEKNGIARQQIALIVTNFATSVVEPSQQETTKSAIKSFSESGKMFRISLVAKSDSGVSFSEIVESPSSIFEKLRIEVDAR